MQFIKAIEQRANIVIWDIYIHKNRRGAAMKCIVYPEVEAGGKLSWSWRLETEAGTVIAKSTRSFDEVIKCERELRDVMSSAHKSKLVREKIQSAPERLLGKIRATLGGA